MPSDSLRPLGRSSLRVSPICLGGNVFGWTVDEAMSFRLLDAWLDSGMNFVDTADVYSRWVPGHSGGESETIIGKWLRQSGKRNRVVLATKVGKPMGDNDKGLSAAYIRRAVDASLRRLKTDVIDLYQSHDDDAETPLEETMAAFAELIKAGKVRAIGASNFSAPRLKLALATSTRLGVPRYESLQPLYNLVERGPTKASSSRSAASAISASSASTPWRAASPASTTAPPTSRKAFAAPARQIPERPGPGGPDRARQRRADVGAKPAGSRLADRPSGNHRADRQRDHYRGADELVAAARLQLGTPSIG
jgi:aryl-alcohol dehydrogenase-like predicted oxidoreductase